MTQASQTIQPLSTRMLRQRVRGVVHAPGTAGYDAHRRAVDPAVDARPVAVIEAFSHTDVAAAVHAARDHALPFAVQATGHGTRVPADGGLLLKTSALRGVVVDTARRVARVGPGTPWADVLAAAAPFGLAPLSGSSPAVGVVGYTLGGGVGWLSRRFGFAADSVLRARVVTADGQTVTASADQHPDLFWALRGGGGNFGVVTTLEFRLYPVSHVLAGVAWFPAERAAEILEAYADWTRIVPDDMSSAVVLCREVRGRRVVGVKVLHSGDESAAERVLRPLWRAAGQPIWDELRTVPFADAAMGGTAARYLNLFPALSPRVVDALVDASAHANTIEIRHWGGAMARPGATAGPTGHRATPYSVIVDTEVPGLAERLRPAGTGGSFLNFLADPARTGSAFTPANYARLREIKAAYDPDNFFHLNHNIPPS